MLKSVDIQNFQSHKNTHLDFTEGVNSIIGISNHGKTAILRAINWVITNRPSGEAFVSNFVRDEKGNQKEDCIVTLVTDEHTVSRIRGAKRNLYVLDGKELEAIGMAVPPEIQAALNFSTVNIQNQMELPFLLASTAGEVAQFFNKIVHLDTIDTYLASVESKKRATKSELDLARTNLKSVQDDLKKYTWTDRAQELIEELKEKQAKAQALFTQREQLRKSIADYVRYQEIIDTTAILPRAMKLLLTLSERLAYRNVLVRSSNDIRASILSYTTFTNILKTIPDIDKATDLISKISLLNQKAAAIHKDKAAISSANTLYSQHSKTLESLGYLTYAEKLIKRINTLSSTKVKLHLEHGRLYAFILEYQDYLNTINSFDKEFKELKEQLPAACPTCGQPISADDLMKHTGETHA